MPRLLVFVNIFVESPTLDDVVHALSQLSDVVELYEVTGEFDIVALVSAADILEFLCTSRPHTQREKKWES